MKPLRIRIEQNLTEFEVKDAIYREYYRHKEHEEYLEKKARLHECSIEYFQAQGVPFENHLSMQLPSAEMTYFQELEKMALQHAIRMLPREDQYIIIASFYWDKKGFEIAEELGITPGTVTKRRKKILSILHDMLREG